MTATRTTSSSATWTAAQLQHLADHAHLSAYDLARSMRHRFGARLSRRSDLSIKQRRYHVLHATRGGTTYRPSPTSRLLRAALAIGVAA